MSITIRKKAIYYYYYFLKCILFVYSSKLLNFLKKKIQYLVWTSYVSVIDPEYSASICMP